MGIGGIASGIGSLVSSIGGLFIAGNQKKLGIADVNRLGTYNGSQFAKDNLALAKNLYGGRMAGAAQAENNAFTSQANTTDLMSRAVSDPNMLMSLAGGLQGNTNNVLAQLAATEASDKLMRAGVLSDANKTMMADEQNVWNDKLRQLQMKIGVRGVGAQNAMNALQDFGSGVSMIGNLFQKK